MSDLKEHIDRLASKFQPISDEQAAVLRFEQSIRPRLKATGFRDRYLKDIAPLPCGPQERVTDICRALFNRVGAIVALVGERGVGKTYIAAKLCRERIENWMDYYTLQPEDRPEAPPRRMGHYIKLVDLIADFKPLYADFGTTETESLMERREQICRHDLLCIDELHECHDQKMKSRVLTDIIDRRYSNLTDTLIISNETSGAFKESIGDSIRSRLQEHGKIISCTWKSFRE